MIIDAREDVVTLSGSLDKNLWPSIQAAANLLLRAHPRGILIDASELVSCSREGAKTFLDAMAYIERYRARILLCTVPDAVMDVIRSVPGARSQLPIALTCAQGRASLDVAVARREKRRRLGRRNSDLSETGQVLPRRILVPLLTGLSSVREAMGLGIALGTIYTLWEPDPGVTRPGRRRIRVAPVLYLTFILEVPRSMPLNTPQPEEEEAARMLFAEAQSLALSSNVRIETQVSRARDVADEIIAEAGRINAELIVISLPPPSENVSARREMMHTLIQNAVCEITVKQFGTAMPQS